MLTEQDEHTILESYAQTKSGHKTARQTGFTSRQVYGCLTRNQVEVTPLSEINRKYRCNEDYFAVIDSHEKAHVLGFWSADGCVYRKDGSRVVQMDLSVVDTDYIEYLKKALSYDGPIVPAVRAKRDYVKITIYSHKMFNDLVRLGITERKSLTLCFPTPEQVPIEFLPSFICGHFEGDGSIWFRKSDATPYAEINTVGTKDMVESIGRLCAQELGVTYTISQNKGPRLREVNTWVLKISGNPQVMKVMKWMYANVPYKMKRKYERYETLLRHYDKQGEFVPDEKWLTQKRERFIETIRKQGIDLGKHLKKEYYLTSPQGIVHHIRGADAFGKEVGMSDTSVIHVAKGRGSIKGWTTPTPDQVSSARTAGTLVTRFY